MSIGSGASLWLDQENNFGGGMVRLFGAADRMARLWTGLLVTAMLLAFGLSSSASAADICNAVALTDVRVAGQENSTDPIYTLKKGEIDEAVSQYNVDKATGEGQFCSHGGDCYPRYVIKDGKKVEALRLTNCKIGAAEPPIAGVPDDGEITYDIDVDRTKNSAAALRQDDLDNTLLNLGMCSACAANAADLYIKHPESKCGTKVAAALAGDKTVIAELADGPDYCQESISEPPSAGNAASPASTPDAAVPTASQAPAPAPATATDPLSMLKIALIVAAVLYFAPTVTAFARRKRNAKAIFILNLLLGWTFLGWVGALIWSVLEDSAVQDRSV